MSPRILWLGGVFDEATMTTNRGISPAAIRWQTGLVTALQAAGAELWVVGHVPEPQWPRGSLRKTARNVGFAPGIQGRAISYWNIPRLRSLSLAHSYRRAVQQLCHTHHPDAVLSYNAYHYNVVAARHVQERLNIPWICVVADGPDSATAERQHERHIAHARGLVHLSWYSYRQATHPFKLHLDGGIERLKFSLDASPQTTGEPLVLYTGSLAPWSGVSYLVSAFRQVKNTDAHLWICGKGTNPEVEQAMAEDDRIKHLGFVSDAELSAISQRAAAFVNPRISRLTRNRHNFPSKVLEYLSYGKPVISTWTEGLAPEYRSVLTVLEEETDLHLAQTIEDVLSWPFSQRNTLAAEIKTFLETQKLWAIQARRLLDWLGGQLNIA